MPVEVEQNARYGRGRFPTLALALACALGLGGWAHASNGPVSVQTDKGAVIGNVDNGVAAFLGIPYAAAPVGELRFRAPQPRAAWTAPRSATDYGSPCPQNARLGLASLDEDCLFLNVWTPLRPGGRKPVMVFIHGGSFTGGNGGAVPGGPDFGGHDIARKSDVVTVSINYRLGVLGYLAAPALDAENPQRVSGNYGLQDQQAALAWVQRNIARFGGDPDNVTIYGESAGGASVLYQLISPGAAGLFHRAIVESSGNASSLPLAAAEAADAPVIAALGCGSAPDVAACLRAVPVETIINSGLRVVPTPIDGYTLPRQPTDAFASGQFNRVPVIIGTNLNEGTYFVAVAALGAGRELTASDYDTAVRANFPSVADQVKAAYPLSAYRTPANTLAAISTDSVFACESEQVRGLLAQHIPTWGYEFVQPNPAPNVALPPALGIDLGDSHTTELAYVFGHDGAGKPLLGQDALLANEVIGYWTRFATSGNPNLALRFAALEDLRYLRALWPRYEARRPLVLSLKLQPTLTTGFAAAHQCGFWNSLGVPGRIIVAVPG